MKFAVREMREEAGLTEQELSEKSGVPLNTILDIESNKIDTCNSKDLSLIADVLKVPVEKLFF